MSMRYEQYESGEGYDEQPEAGGADREISLGTTTVLGIFLGLALVCALFFGFGYSMGKKSVPGALANVSTDISAPLPESHPAPGSLANSNVGGSTYVPPTERAGGGDARTTDADSGARAPAGQRTKPAAATAVVADSGSDAATSPENAQRQQVARAVEQARAAPTDAPKAPAVAAAGTVYVQVTAISAAHRGDAEMLVNSLKRKGYAAAIHPGAADDLLHVQMGPFATKKDAEAMRQRLSADGYNSILK